MRQSLSGFCTAFLVALVAVPAAVATCTPPSGPDLDDLAGHAAVARTDALLAEPGEGPGAVAVLTDTRWEAPHHGGGGERSYSVACDPGWVAVGIHGRAGDHIHRIGLVCQLLHSDGTLGSEVFRKTVGGEAGESFLLSCPPGRAVGGLGGQADAHLERLQIICDTLPGTTLSYSNFVGGPGGTPFTDVAPARYFLTGLVGHSGAQIDGIWSVYNKVDP